MIKTLAILGVVGVMLPATTFATVVNFPACGTTSSFYEFDEDDGFAQNNAYVSVTFSPNGSLSHQDNRTSALITAANGYTLNDVEWDKEGNSESWTNWNTLTSPVTVDPNGNVKVDAVRVKLTAAPCPPPVDTDNDDDGVPNNIDLCPEVSGPVENNGCPIEEPEDSDGDGVVDEEDSCPEEAGNLENGCPEVIPEPEPESAPSSNSGHSGPIGGGGYLKCSFWDGSSVGTQHMCMNENGQFVTTLSWRGMTPFQVQLESIKWQLLNILEKLNNL
jgi:hypothetical protein